MSKMLDELEAKINGFTRNGGKEGTYIDIEIKRLKEELSHLVAMTTPLSTTNTKTDISKLQFAISILENLKNNYLTHLNEKNQTNNGFNPSGYHCFYFVQKNANN